MNTPDSRPIGVLTAEILATASHWCLHGNGIADTRPSSLLVLRPPEFDEDLPLLTCEGECYWNDDSGWMCYPCTLQPNGLVVPELWPVLDGEEEIEEWRNADCSVWSASLRGNCWWLSLGDFGIASVGIDARPNMHPAPRKGVAGPVWVWEADKC